MSLDQRVTSGLIRTDEHTAARRELLKLRDDAKKRYNLPKKPIVPFEKKVIPKGATLGFLQFPVEIQISGLGAFLGLVALMMPYWASNEQQWSMYANWGLWHVCASEQKHCNTIHDNLVDGAEVPVWYVLVQWSFLIGTLVTLVVLGVVGNSINHKVVKLSPTSGMAVKCLSLIAAMEKFLAVYTFDAHSSEFSHWLYSAPGIEYHSAFYCAILSCIIDVILAVYVFLNEEITVFRRPLEGLCGPKGE